MLGHQYELIFSSDFGQIIPLMGQYTFRLLIWDLDGVVRPSLQNDDMETCHTKVLDTLKVIRGAHPELGIVLVAGEFEYAFQAAVVKQNSSVRFINKPWESTQFIEKVQVLLGDKKSSIRQWVLKMPLGRKREI